MRAVAEKRALMLAVWKESIEAETMVLMMAALKVLRRVAEKAASMVEWTVLHMVGKLVSRMVA